MSDVERICAANYARVRWADEYRDVEPVELPEDKSRHKTMDRYRGYRAATLLAAALGGVGMAFLCIGIAIMHFPTLIMGLVMAIVFTASGYCFDVEAEKELDDVLQ